MKPKIHLIIVHPRKDSFNYGLYSAAEQYLQKARFNTVTSDLYDMHKNHHPAIKPYGDPLFKNNHTKIKQEQTKIKSSQITLIQFPLYWCSIPGLLKNYIDTVWESKFDFGCGRNVMLSITTLGKKEDFNRHSLLGTIEKITYPTELAFKSVGYTILPHYIAYGVTEKSPEALEKTKHSFVKHLAKNLKDFI